MRTFRLVTIALTMATLLAVTPAARAGESQPVFAMPDQAVLALIDVVAASDLPRLIALMGPGSDDLVSNSDPETGSTQSRGVRRRHRRGMAARGPLTQGQITRGRQRGLAVSRAAGRRAGRMALRRGGWP